MQYNCVYYCDTCYLDESRRDVRAHNLQHGGLDVRVCDALDVTIAHLLVPDLQRLAPFNMHRE
jgi:hypothetical protein